MSSALAGTVHPTLPATAFHKMSPKHLNRYVQELAGKYNVRESDTLDRMREVVSRFMGRTLPYRRLITPNGLPSGARSQRFHAPGQRTGQRLRGRAREVAGRVQHGG